MLPHEQLIVGVVTGLMFCALLRWTPLLRDLLATAAIVGLIGLVTSNGQGRHDSILAGLPNAILSHPHFCLGVMMAFTGVLLALHIFRTRAR